MIDFSLIKPLIKFYSKNDSTIHGILILIDFFD